MHPNPVHRQTSEADMLALARVRSFGILAVNHDDGPLLSHIPFTLSDDGTLAMAKAQGFDCYSLSFDYGQRHQSELEAAKKVAKQMDATEHKMVKLDLSTIGGSALTDLSIAVPEHQDSAKGIPITYVPARNTIFLSIGLGWAEVLGAQNIFIGVNAVDYSGYPDCRPDYISAYEKMANLATKASVEGQKLKMQTPLMKLSKAEIIAEGTRLGVNYSLTVSCYQANEHGEACGKCDSCYLRREGFEQAGISDPTRYQIIK